MHIPYFYEPDCFNLNRKARLSNAAVHRIFGLVEKMMPQSFSAKAVNPSNCEKEIVNSLLKKIYSVNENIDWSQTLAEASYVVFDTETTGFQPAKDKIIEIGCVIIENGCIRNEKTFVELVNPKRPIPGPASHITGITDGMVAEKRTLPEVLHDFMQFTENRVLVAHSASFDMAFLNREVGRLAPMRIYNPVIDTHMLARYLLPEMEDHSLNGLARLFDIEIKGRHTALGDSLMTAELFLKLLELLKQYRILDLHDLVHYLQVQKSIFNP